jgi:hypothetical protein
LLSFHPKENFMGSMPRLILACAFSLFCTVAYQHPSVLRPALSALGLEVLPGPTDRELVALLEEVRAAQTKTERDEARARLMHFRSELSRRR